MQAEDEIAGVTTAIGAFMQERWGLLPLLAQGWL